jgi:hypothetical protein
MLRNNNEVNLFDTSGSGDCLVLFSSPDHEGTVGNETADKSARTGSEHPFIGVAKKVVRD